jgi:hypothetical protein
MVNDIVGFGSLILFFLVNILSELPIKCVIEFGRFVKILEDKWKCSERKGPVFSKFSRIELSVGGLKMFCFQANGRSVELGDLYLFSYLSRVN